MQNTTQKTNERMPSRSDEVIGKDVGNNPQGAKPSDKATPPQAPKRKQKPVIKVQKMPRGH
jgi:hypothetical protein